MAELILLLGLLSPLLYFLFVVVAWCYLMAINFHVKQSHRLLQELVDLQRIRRDLSALDAEQSKKDEGSGKGRSEIVDPGASYGDLSRVGLLKKPKP